ncbi:hypothetical protein PT015_11060 [Candidatus Mycobacterium wuenschmannii]|uniref:Secreted protein n=1 Tax=Candidatus Mycobacterium wuenschmannii TaxID=3027808 RepID=A0ABY8W1Z5_9MYCO|nr:hypothetical protein [Candidatus Mycobacterium wuenschmannii]WIM89910.1 hypothetical protein PT015_11060 [Candidatus Mycobacterium wuenschmannii]
MQSYARRAAIGAAAILAIVGSTGVSPRATAEGPDCVPDATVQCAQQAQEVRPDPHAGKHLTLTCSPAMTGAHCTQRWVP